LGKGVKITKFEEVEEPEKDFIDMRKLALVPEDDSVLTHEREGRH